MTYQPKPGDRVTSPLLVGEWKVTHVYQDKTRADVKYAEQVYAVVPCDTLTPVAPPLPPEPPVGSVVRADGKFWGNTRDGWSSPGVSHWQSWAHLATAPDLSPVVAVDDVANWLALEAPMYHALGQRFADRFGWGKP